MSIDTALERINPLKIFIQPRKVISVFFTNPNILFSIILVLLPAVIGILTLISWQAMPQPVVIAIQLAKAIIAWLILSAIAFALGLLFNLKEIKKNFSSVLSVISLQSIPWIIFAIILALTPLAMPGINDFAKIKANYDSGIISADTAGTQALELMQSSSVNGLALAVLNLIQIILLIAFIVIAFFVSLKISGKNFLKAIILWIIQLALIVLALPSLFALF